MTEYHHIIIYNDPKTPFNFVANLIQHITGSALYDCKEIARRINSIGKHTFGPYPVNIATAIVEEAHDLIKESDYKLLVESLNTREENSSEVLSCSFCKKLNTEVEKMFSGSNGLICNQCVVGCAGQLQDEIATARLRYTYQLLDWHFGDVPADSMVKTNRSYPGRVRADLQRAIENLFSTYAIRTIGIKQNHGNEKIDLSVLWGNDRHPHVIAPLSYEELDVGDSEPMKCQINGLWLLQKEDARYAVILSRESDYSGGYTIFIEISGPQGEQTTNITREIFDKIEATIQAAQSYRGKVLSLEQSPHYGGTSTGITVHKIQSVNRDDIILPQNILESLDRTVIRFCANRHKLRTLGLQTKRGVMFHGPPGTGKTHTIRYLASQLKDHTTFLVTAEQIALLPEYFSLARLMQPVIFVIEDADLLAKSRENMHSPQEEAMLNHLLNEMDGLKEDADILFILTTNKPNALEEALVSRPGRIDQLIEFPRPDTDCRHGLIDLYCGKLEILEILKDDIVNRTKGVSASFIKELMRRLAQYSIERGTDGQVCSNDIEQALAEMIFSNNTLNRSILGVE